MSHTSEELPALRINPLLPISVFVLLILSLGSLMFGVAYESTRLHAMSAFFAMIFVALSALLGALLRQHWGQRGYPPKIAASIAIAWGAIAFVGWWAVPGSSDSVSVSEQQRALCSRAKALILAIFLLAASLVFVPSELWPTRTLVFVAEALLFWKYVSVTLDYMESDD